MKDKTSKSADQLFREVLNDHTPEFNPLAWEHMKTLLDEDDIKPVLIALPQSKNKHYKLILIIMTTLGILSIASYLFINSYTSTGKLELPSTINSASSETSASSKNRIESNSSNSNSESNPLNSASNDAKDDANSDLKNNSRSTGNNSSSKSSVTTKNSNSKSTASNSLSKDLNSVSQNKTIELNSDGDGNPPYKDSVETIVQNGKTYRVFKRTVWVEDEYRYFEKPSTKSINDGWFGIHFTAQGNRKTDSLSAGFNIQFMSGNRLENKDFGLYGGFDFGMQFYGKSKKSGVVLNNTSQDSGYTRLRTYSMDFLGRGHFEYSKFALIPYINVMGGPRIYSTGQVVSSYIHYQDAENSSYNNAHTSVSMLYGFGFGARLRISKVVSLDARYEWINGTPVKLVDMNNSKFNGLNYELKYNKVAPKMEQFKIGIIFNLSETEYEKTLVKEGYYKNYSIDSVEVTSSDSNTIFMPCNCAPCDKKSNTLIIETPNDGSSDVYPQNNNNTTPSGGSGGGGKKSFPGIKPPTPSRPTEKR